MLYKFKSEVTADLIMLEALARQILQLLGQDQPRGILAVHDMPAALAAMKQALADHERAQRTAGDAAAEEEGQSASFKARVWPFLSMIERCQKEQVPITWGA